MARSNRVQPDGIFGTLPVRGAFTGNRGALCNAEGKIVRRCNGRRWITCTLREKPGRGGHPLDAPNRYTPLFFLDEAAACAAGHRPCAECRRAAYRSWCDAWRVAVGKSAKADEMDAVLHAARLGPRIRERPIDLPPGAFIQWAGRPHLIRDGIALPYLGDSYGPAVPLPGDEAEVLTPAPTLAVMRAGFRPALSATEDRPNW